MRLKQLMNVLLPHPDGPMNAVTVFRWTSRLHVLDRRLAAVRHGEIGDGEDLLAALDVGSLESAPRETSAMRVLSICGVSICVIASPPLLAVAVAKEDRHGVHAQDDHEQDDRSGRGEGLEPGSGCLVQL